MAAYPDCELRASTQSGFACQFVFEGVLIEVVVAEPVVMAWQLAPDEAGMRRLKKIARTIARVQIEHVNADVGEWWRVVVDRGTTSCQRVAES
ncbi:MAG TPA: hypothetical protein VFZ65_00955 [Planctomycetota bacterium]|nr:hypothetical protein [Planctomycetota bacterium]